MSWYVAPSLETLWGQVRSTWANRSTAADGTIGDAAHAQRKSDHNPDPKTGVVRALDVTVNKAQSERVLNAVVGDERVAYVIYNRRIWTPGKGWQPYSGSNPHSGHVHVSLKHSKAAEDSRALWKGLEAPKMHPIIGPGYLSSAYGNRGGVLHAGADYRPTAGWGAPVYATYAGTVIKTVANRKPGQRDRVNELAAYRTGNGVRVQNPDGEQQLYGHVKPAVRVGQQVKAGDLIGHVDNSGNTSGPHVHFEIWNSRGATRNPQLDFRYYGVDPFGGKKVAPKPPAPKPPAPPAPKPSGKKRKGPSGQSGKTTRDIQNALRATGDYTGLVDEDYGPMLIDAVTAYQRRHGLYPDGDWGPVTQRYYEWVKALQRALNKWKAVQRIGRLYIDGSRDQKTVRAEDAVIALPANRRVLGIRNSGTQVQKRADLYIGLGIGPVPPKRG